MLMKTLSFICTDIGRVLVIGGPVSAHTSVERLRGFAHAAREFPGIVLLATLACNYDRPTARLFSEAWLRLSGAPDACLAANDVMALGVLDALETLKLQSTVVGVNAIPEAIQAIACGRLLASADFNAMQIAYLATECALRHLGGEAVPARINLQVQIVTQQNYRAWDLPYEQRPVITLDMLRVMT
jgi:ribose transport system substrate-binding protein